MKIVISGYGKMGKMVEKVLIEKNLTCAGKSENITEFDRVLAHECVCIDFTVPDAFRTNYKFLAENFKAVVVGTTGWEDIKNDASSVVGLVENDFRLRDFRWLPEERPASRYDVCTRGVRPSMRMEAKGFAIPSYRETDFYFDGYMSPLLAEVRSGMVSRDSLRRAESVRKGDDTGRKDENRRLEAQEQKDAYAREDVRRTIVNDSRKSYFSLYIGEKMSKGMGMEEVSRMKQAIKYSQDKISNDQRRKEKYNKERKKDKIRF